VATKILVIVEDDGQADAVDFCKQFENYDGVVGAAIVRNSAEKFPTDKYFCTTYTTDLAIKRLEGNSG
jgi:hypothetical protein